MMERDESGEQTGEQFAVSGPVAEAGSDRPVDGIDERTSQVNPDSAVDTLLQGETPGLGGSEQGGMAGATGYFEGEGNEGAVAPLGGDPAKSAADGRANSQGGVASGAPE
jgi:hypothetical protein